MVRLSAWTEVAGGRAAPPLVWSTEAQPRAQAPAQGLGSSVAQQASESAYLAESSWQLFKLDTGSLQRGQASDKSPGFRVVPAAHICPGESFKATTVCKHPAAAIRASASDSAAASATVFVVAAAAYFL